MYCAVDCDNHKLIAVHTDHRIAADLAWLYTDQDLEIAVFDLDNLEEIIELGSAVLVDIISSLGKPIHSKLFDNVKAFNVAVKELEPPVVNPFILDMQIKHAEKDRSKFYAWKANSSTPNEHK